MSAVLAAHVQIANSMVLYFLLVGLWGVFLGIRRQKDVGSAYRGALMIALGLAAVQLLVGVVLLIQAGGLRNDTHILYGLSAVITLPLVHQFVAGKYLSPPLAYGVGALFMAGLAIRGITTGGG